MKFKLNKHLLRLCLLLLIFPATILAQEKSEKVLFVGNSFTYFYNMPQMVEAMAKIRELIYKPLNLQLAEALLLNTGTGKKALKPGKS